MKPDSCKSNSLQPHQPKPEPLQPKPCRTRPKAERQSKKTTLIALCLVFLLPMALAWLTLQQGWFTTGVSNAGQWVTGQIAADSQWRLIVPQAADCAPCADLEPLMAQLILALGRDAKRVRLMITPTSSELEAGFVYIADPPGTLILRYAVLEPLATPPKVLSQPLGVDPQRPPPELSEDMRADDKSSASKPSTSELSLDMTQRNQVMAKALLKDLRRLLTYSRAG